jgi:uncharacterized protein (TIGR02145 family)
MKKIRASVKFGLLLALTVVFLNCKKDKVDPIPSIWNYSTFTDVRDGKTYKSIKIGNQEWMAENLAYKTPSGSWDYGDLTLANKYGRLYNWEAAKQAVPAGWHLPTDAEWKQLEIFLGMSQADADGVSSRGAIEGGKLKSLSGWAKEGHGTDAVGFAALPGGLFMTNSNDFMAVDWYGYWWTATESDNSNVWFRLIVNGNSKIIRNLSIKQDGFSVRCIKN